MKMALAELVSFSCLLVNAAWALSGCDHWSVLNIYAPQAPFTQLFRVPRLPSSRINIYFSLETSVLCPWKLYSCTGYHVGEKWYPFLTLLWREIIKMTVFQLEHRREFPKQVLNKPAWGISFYFTVILLYLIASPKEEAFCVMNLSNCLQSA